MDDDKDDGPELPLPVQCIKEDSLFDVSSETLDVKLLFLGLDNAGKTTLLHMLKDDKIAQHEPTVHPLSEEIIIGKFRFLAFDLAGHETGRILWRDYFPMAGAIFFLVDSSDRSRFPEAAEEIAKLLKAPALEAVPLVVCGMKTDLKEAASKQEFEKALNLQDLWASSRKVKLFMCSIVQRQGYGDAIRWLMEVMEEQRVKGISTTTKPAPTETPANDFADDLDV